MATPVSNSPSPGVLLIPALVGTIALLTYGIVGFLGPAEDSTLTMVFVVCAVVLVVAMIILYRYRPPVVTEEQLAARAAAKAAAREPAATATSNIATTTSTTATEEEAEPAPKPVVKVQPATVIQAKVVPQVEESDDPEALEEQEIVAKVQQKMDRHQAAKDRIAKRRGDKIEDLDMLADDLAADVSEEPLFVDSAPAAGPGLDGGLRLVPYPEEDGPGFYGNAPVQIDGSRVLLVKVLLASVSDLEDAAKALAAAPQAS